MNNESDFIAIYDNVISPEECQTIIDEFESVYEKSPHTLKSHEMSRYGGEFNRKDYALFANDGLYKTQDIINPALQKCIDLYIKEYFILNQVKASSLEIKVQKTPPRGGYHVWHCESQTFTTCRRVLAWMFYLNSFPDGEGETEFLWQGVRVKPQAGRYVMWPAAWTHTHRGNPVYSQSKYIVTGWYTHTPQ